MAAKKEKGGIESLRMDVQALADAFWKFRDTVLTDVAVHQAEQQTATAPGAPAIATAGEWTEPTDVQVQQDKKGGVRVIVAPGQPVLVGRLTLVFEGEAGNDIAFTALRENLPLKENDVFHHGQYEKLKSGVQALALERPLAGAVLLR